MDCNLRTRFIKDLPVAVTKRLLLKVQKLIELNIIAEIWRKLVDGKKLTSFLHCIL